MEASGGPLGPSEAEDYGHQPEIRDLSHRKLCFASRPLGDAAITITATKTVSASAGSPKSS